MTIKKQITEQTWRITDPEFKNNLIELLGLDPRDVIKVNIYADPFEVVVSVEYSGRVIHD
jgi:hypothetical protein